MDSPHNVFFTVGSLWLTGAQVLSRMFRSRPRGGRGEVSEGMSRGPNEPRSFWDSGDVGTWKIVALGIPKYRGPSLRRDRSLARLSDKFSSLQCTGNSHTSRPGLRVLDFGDRLVTMRGELRLSVDRRKRHDKMDKEWNRRLFLREKVKL